MGLEPTNLLTASQALYQLSYAPVDRGLTLPVPIRPLEEPGHLATILSGWPRTTTSER